MFPSGVIFARSVTPPLPTEVIPVPYPMKKLPGENLISIPQNSSSSQTQPSLLPSFLHTCSAGKPLHWFEKFRKAVQHGWPFLYFVFAPLLKHKQLITNILQSKLLYKTA